MPSGGPRAGKPGNLRPNRSDLNQPKLAPVGQEYGQGQQVLNAQSSQPLPNMQAGGQPANPRVPVDDMRGKIPSLSDPTSRPGEPVTAGLPVGPGAGPEGLSGGVVGPPQELMILRAIFQAHPNEDLQRLIEFREDSL